MTLKGQPLNPVKPEIRKALNLCDAEQRAKVLDWIRGRKKQKAYRTRSPEKVRVATREWRAKAVARGHYKSGGAGYKANRASMAKNQEYWRKYHQNYYVSVTRARLTTQERSQ